MLFQKLKKKKKPGGTVGKNRRYSWLVSINWLVSFSVFDGEISTQHPHSEPLRAGMYPLDPALHSFLAEKLGNPFFFVLTCIIKRSYMASRQRQSNRVDYGLQSFTSRLDLKSLEITVDLFSCSFFFFIIKEKIKNAQNDQLTRHTKCGKKGKWKIGLRYPEAWGRSQYWHAHCSHPDQS